MLDLRDLKVAAPGIMRRAPASEFNGTKNLPQCAVCICDGDVCFDTLPVGFSFSLCHFAMMELQCYHQHDIHLTRIDEFPSVNEPMIYNKADWEFAKMH